MLHKFKALSKLKKTGLGIAALLIVAAIAGGNQPPKQANLTLQNADSKAAGSLQNSGDSAQKKAPAITTQTITTRNANL